MVQRTCFHARVRIAWAVERRLASYRRCTLTKVQSRAMDLGNIFATPDRDSLKTPLASGKFCLNRTPPFMLGFMPIYSAQPPKVSTPGLAHPMRHARDQAGFTRAMKVATGRLIGNLKGLFMSAGAQ